jgi:fructose-bisphosphate aldolase class I
MGETTQTAALLVRSGKGILAADESISTMNARLTAAGVAGTEENRRAYREMLVTTPNLGEGVSGVILCDETFRQRLGSGEAFPAALAARGLLPGVKVDTGTKPLAGASGEKITEGLDGLWERLAKYSLLGARFAKWRAVFPIGDAVPTWRGLRANTHALTRYASACHEAGLVPIVEPEVLMDGPHSAERCASVTAAVLLSLIAELQDYGIRFDAVVLKTNMILPGRGSGATITPREVASRTVDAFSRIVPEEVAGIAFLSGGQGTGAATANLAAVPWSIPRWRRGAVTRSACATASGPSPTGWRATWPRCAAATGQPTRTVTRWPKAAASLTSHVAGLGTFAGPFGPTRLFVPGLK